MNPTPFNYSESLSGLMTPTPPPVGTPFLDISSFNGSALATDAVAGWNIAVAPFWDMIGFLIVLALVLAGIFGIVRIVRQL